MWGGTDTVTVTFPENDGKYGFSADNPNEFMFEGQSIEVEKDKTIYLQPNITSTLSANGTQIGDECASDIIEYIVSENTTFEMVECQS